MFIVFLSSFILKWCPPPKKIPLNKQITASELGYFLQEKVAFKPWAQQFSKKFMPANSTFHLKIEYYQWFSSNRGRWSVKEKLP